MIIIKATKSKLKENYFLTMGYKYHEKYIYPEFLITDPLDYKDYASSLYRLRWRYYDN